MNALGIDGSDIPFAQKSRIGKIHDYASGRNRYIGYLISIASNSYKKLRIGLDCANGAAWSIATAVFSALGAQTYTIGNEPDGFNINDGYGSTSIENLQKLVKEKHLDIGFAFDGDADRCLAVDENGNVVDGDAIIYILAKRLKARGTLNGNTVVSTVMSNSGFIESLDRIGIKCIQTSVGDRFVYEAMQEYMKSKGSRPLGVYKLAGLDVSIGQRIQSYSFLDIKFTETELFIIRLLIRSFPIRQTAKQIIRYAYPKNCLSCEAVVRTHISKINKKFSKLTERHLITSEMKAGYIIDTPMKPEISWGK
jgi:hypothetical protein